MCQASLAIDLPWLREFGARNTDEDGQATRLTGPIATPVPAGLLRCTLSFPLNEDSYEIAHLPVSWKLAREEIEWSRLVGEDQSWNLIEGCKKSNSMIRWDEGSFEFQLLVLN